MSRTSLVWARPIYLGAFGLFLQSRFSSNVVPPTGVPLPNCSSLSREVMGTEVATPAFEKRGLCSSANRFLAGKPCGLLYCQQETIASC